MARLGELYKGHDMALRAMPLILAREPKARYVIVGDGLLRSYLERLAVSMGVERSVTFTGELPSAALDERYARADVITMLSRESPIDGGAEGYGLIFVEAGAWSKPVVGGRSGGIPDAVVDGVTGLLVDPTDIGAIAEALLRVLSDTALARRLGEQGPPPRSERVVVDELCCEVSDRARHGAGQTHAHRYRRIGGDWMKPVQILYVNPTGQLGGAEYSLLDLAGSLDRTRFVPVLACLGDGPLAAAASSRGIQVVPVQLPRRFAELSLKGERSGPAALAAAATRRHRSRGN